MRGAATSITISLGSVVTAPATKLVFATPPAASVTAGAAFSQQPVVQVQDASGAVVVSGAPISVALSAYTDSGCSTTLSTGLFSAISNPISSSSGNANFVGVTHTKAETIYLKATGGGLSSACSPAVVVAPGPASQLGFTQQPSSSGTAGIAFAQQPKVAILDASGNLVAAASDSVTLTAYQDAVCTTTLAPIGGNWALNASSNPVATSGGIATFVALGYTKAISIYLKASSGSGYASACSAKTSITAGSPSNLILTGLPQTTFNQCSAAYTVSFTDTYGNPSNSSGIVVTLSGKGSGQFFSDPNCLTQASTITVANANASKAFYFSDATEENLTFSVSAPSLTGTSLPITNTHVTQIVAGVERTCGIRLGSLQCWGPAIPGTASFFANLSFSTSFFNGLFGAYNPGQVVGLETGVSSVSVGNRVDCAIVNGAAMCWGGDESGELGDNGALGAAGTGSPTQVTGLTSGVTAISVDRSPAYWAHVCAVMSGAAYCWGVNGSGELGIGVAGAQRNFPAPVVGLTSGVTAIASGGAYPWFSAGSSSGNHSCAVVNGGVQCWGDMSKGELGNGSTGSYAATPVQVTGLAAGAGAIQVVAGDRFSCALVTGVVLCWGLNDSGQLGNGTTTGSSVPVQVTGLTSGVTQISAGINHACAIQAGASLCWGGNDGGQLGNGTLVNRLTPVQVSNHTSGVSQITAGAHHSCDIISGQSRCWGLNSKYAVSSLAPTSDIAWTPVGTDGLGSGVTSGTAVGDGTVTWGSSTCALVGGGIQCWGANVVGQLGNGTTQGSPTPIAVPGLTSGVTQVAGGVNQVCAIHGGLVSCWGYQADMSNPGNYVTAYSPVPVSGLTNATQVTVGFSSGCALQGGAAFCWGTNAGGQLGNGSNAAQSAAGPVQGLSSGVTSISLSAGFACAVMNGGAWCWGNNQFGNLANGTTTNTTVPVQVTGLSTGVTAVSTGNLSACALLASGSVKCWGYNGTRSLGDGTANSSSVPVQVSGITSGATQIIVNNSGACALVNGGAQCWGYNQNGSLGIGSGTGASAVPVQVSGLASGVTTLVSSYNADHNCAISTGGALSCWGANTWGNIGSTAVVPVQFAPFLIQPW